jgi:hypothetical protein
MLLIALKFLVKAGQKGLRVFLFSGLPVVFIRRV